MEIKDIFIVRPTDNEQKEFIITMGKHLATKRNSKQKKKPKTTSNTQNGTQHLR